MMARYTKTGTHNTLAVLKRMGLKHLDYEG